MLVPHTCLNAAIGNLFRKPAAAAVAGLAGHALLDLLPHKDISAHKAEGAAVALLLGIVGSSCGWSSPAFWCAIGGVLPDVEQALPWTDPRRGRRRYFPTHRPGLHSLQLPQAPKYRVSLLEQTVVSAVSLAVVMFKCRPDKCRPKE